MRARLHKVAECEPEDVEWHAKQIEKELDSFGRTNAWKSVRAQDKKTVTEFRNRLREAHVPGLKKLELTSLLEPFVEFVDSFEAINQREILLNHDREISAQCALQMETVITLMATQPEEAQLAFLEVLSTASALYGRSAELDSFIRKTRKAPPNADELSITSEIFTGLLANLSLY